LEIAIVVLSITTISFCLSYFYVLKRLSVVSRAFVETLAMNKSLRDALDLSLEDPTTKDEQDIHKENFIKFLSDSRDWAFEYIEDVQKQLDAFTKEVESEIKYFDEFGVVGSAYPHYFSMKKISSAYKDLKKLLPKEADDRR